MVVEFKNGKASELMGHYRVVTKSQGRSPPPLIALPRPRGHMTHPNITLKAHGQTILTIHNIMQRKDPGPPAKPPGPVTLTAMRQKKHLSPPQPITNRTLCDIVKKILNITYIPNM